MDNNINFDFDFYKYILKKETISCMLTEQSISEFNRASLIDWIVGLGCQFGLENSSIHLTVLLIDNFLSKKLIRLRDLELVGAACFSIACKYDAYYLPKLSAIVYSMEGAGTELDLKEMEVSLLNTVDFNLTSPTANTFLCNLVDILPKDLFHNSFNFSSYYIELFLLTTSAMQFSYSLVAASSLTLARIILEIEDPWPNKMIMITNLSLSNMYDCILFLSSLVSAASEYDPTKTVRNKYSHWKFNSVSKLKQPNNLMR